MLGCRGCKPLGRHARLRGLQPGLRTERERIRKELQEVRQRFEGVRRFVEQGDGSAKVRQWLAQLEHDEARLEGAKTTSRISGRRSSSGARPASPLPGLR